MRYFRNPDVKNLCLLLGLVTLGATIAGFLAGVGTGYLVLLVCLLFCGICLGHTLWRHRQMERLADCGGFLADGVQAGRVAVNFLHIGKHRINGGAAHFCGCCVICVNLHLVSFPSGPFLTEGLVCLKFL